MEKGLLEKTGKSLPEWIKIVRASGIEKHKEIINFLKTEHGFTYGFANFVAHKSKATDAGSQQDDDLVANQYKGKEVLFPIYQEILSIIAGFGDDIEIAPKKSSVSLRRKRQFALIQPSTKTRIDLGLKLNDAQVSGRLEPSGPFGTMCSHRIQLTVDSAIDEEVIKWLTLAYEQAS